MTETDDRAIDAARSNASALGRNTSFRSIRATVRDGETAVLVSRLVAGADLTYRHYRVLLDRLPSLGDTGTRLVRVAPDTDPGFLISVRRLVHKSVAEFQAGGRVTAPVRRRFVYAGNQFELTLTRASIVGDATVNGRNHGPAISGQFEIQNLAARTTTSFTMLFGARGAEAETPLRIVYRPRWWVELELRLVDPVASRTAFAFPVDSPK